MEKTWKERIFMENRKYPLKMTGFLLAVFLLLFGSTVQAAPSVEGDTELTAVTDEVVSAEYTITSDEDMESVTLTLSYDKDVLTYMAGSGGNNFSGSGGNGSVQLSSRPGTTTATFSVKFKGRSDGETQINITGCTITVNGTEVDVTESEGESEGDDFVFGENNDQLASFVIDDRTFYTAHPDAMDDFDRVHLDIQGIDTRVMKHVSLDVYVVKLISDNGSFRDNFVYNPDTGNVIPFVQMDSGTDQVIFLEPEENIHVPTRYIPVDLGWGPKYTIPAYKHVIIDGIDEILDDTNRYLVYGINQDGEKNWYSFDYDKNSLQLFDDVAYQGEQNYILNLEETVSGVSYEASVQLERYNRDMGRRLNIIMIMTILLIVLINTSVILYLRMRKMHMPEQKSEEEPEEPENYGSYVTGDLEEDETDFQEPSEDDDEDDEIELEIIDLDAADDEEPY